MMTNEEALSIALKIVATCNEFDDVCDRCPFNIDGCIVSGNNDIPRDWDAANIIKHFIRMRKEEKTK